MLGKTASSRLSRVPRVDHFVSSRTRSSSPAGRVKKSVVDFPEEETEGFGGVDFVGAVSELEQALGIFGFEFADADPEKEASDRPDHFTEEPLPFDADFDVPFPRVGHGNFANRFYSSADLALWVSGEGCEVVFANENFCRALHGNQCRADDVHADDRSEAPAERRSRSR